MGKNDLFAIKNKRLYNIDNYLLNIRGSSNGRTAGFDPANPGSSPGPRAWKGEKFILSQSK